MRPMKPEQLIQQVQTTLKQLRCDGEGQDLWKITLAWAQLATGAGFPLLAEPHRFVPQLKCEMIESIRTGMTTIDAQIESTTSFVHAPRRVGDVHMVDEICSDDRFTATQIKRINVCRLVYLQITLLSDIATPCGKFINCAYYNGDITNRINWPSVQYPRQPKPDKTSWAAWCQGLRLVHLCDDKEQLRKSLGAWKAADPYHHRWRWNFAADGIYQQTPSTTTTKYHLFHSYVWRNCQFHLASEDILATDPILRDSFPIDIAPTPRQIIVPFNQIFPFP